MKNKKYPRPDPKLAFAGIEKTLAQFLARILTFFCSAGGGEGNVPLLPEVYSTGIVGQASTPSSRTTAMPPDMCV